MRERLKYSLNGVSRCDNFAQHLANKDFIPEPIGSAGGFDDWTIEMSTNFGNWRVVYPLIQSLNLNKESTIKYLFGVIKKDGSTSFLETDSDHFYPDEGIGGKNWDIMELLNEKNGYLDNGALVIEYGVQVESILGEDKIWRFNTDDPIFECEEKKNMIHFPYPETPYFSYYHVHKQLLTFHSTYFYRQCQKVKGNFKELLDKTEHYGDLECFLQISQGVREQETHVATLGYIMNFAITYSFPNVIRYCERQLIENDLKFRRIKNWVIRWGGLRHYLVHLLKNVKSLKEMIDETDIQEMSGETMKIFIAKFLYNKF